jgi:hypothetical protein
VRKILTAALCTGAAILRTWSDMLWDASERLGDDGLTT